ncbi:glycosyltransferase [Salinicoccus roseus]|uniref:Glycosyltransferase 2-like domain-containing protein n=1 Tax=Salinicoccus roseus TaxID=45670 RepID=A0A265E5M7_9STAP|nr:glycosyltransferase [Salinicoccus roseus]OZT76894.1 hypothetical protein CFN03_07385 [Salinicoccus roseus]
MNIKKTRSEIEALKNELHGVVSKERGLSIIVPVHDGLEYMDECLTSLASQKVTTARYEVIIVLNGRFAKEFEHLYKETTYHETLDMIILINDQPGAGAARNLGMDYAKYSHITFVDIDDRVSERFVQSNFDHMDDNQITLSQLHDLRPDGTADPDNLINRDLMDAVQDDDITYRKLTRILTVTVCKAIPANFLKQYRFKPYLRSGEDTVLFTEMLLGHHPKVAVIPLEEEAVYYRRMSSNSVSRQSASFDFLITQRLEIMKIFDPMLSNITDAELQNITRQKYRAQIVFMNRYLQDNPKDYQKVLEEIEIYQLQHFDYKLLNRSLADTLVISYCFAPYSDTSATIAVKRIIENRKPVDVISNKMYPIRSKDPTLSKAVEPYLSHSAIVDARPAFSNFKNISRFIDASFNYYSRNSERYENIYSRAMFPASHLPPLFIKMADPGIRWVAEFSDPLFSDIDSKERYVAVNSEALVEAVKNGVLGPFTPYADDNLFNLVELIPFALADELIFTNEHQLQYMISRFPDDLKMIIESKAQIKRHPTLPEAYYNLVESEYPVIDGFINVAYFGNFYSRRDVNEILEIKAFLEAQSAQQFKFHVFTNIANLPEEKRALLEDNDVIVNGYVPYFEFLNLCNRFDILMVFDADTKEIKPFNPYLPSKLSDYLGSNALTLALVESGSIMSRIRHEDLYTIDLEDMTKMNFDPEQMMERILAGKKETAIEAADATIIRSEGYELEVNDALEIIKEGEEWQIQPKSLPITEDGPYTLTIHNNGRTPATLMVESFYAKRGIITVEVGDSSFSISEFNGGADIFMAPGSTTAFRIKYNKGYDKASFLKAGRLNFTLTRQGE